MKPIPLLAAGLALSFWAGCASTHYSVYEGAQVVAGTGGSKHVVAGIDFWTLGTPPRKFQVIGIIDDVRRESLLGLAGYESTLAKQAKAAGGHAIVFIDRHREFAGFYHSGSFGTAHTTGTLYGNSYSAQTTYDSSGSLSVPLHDRITRAAVLKYVD